jgi:chemotaxis protein MotB
MRKKKAASHENHERWLVSYADFITLLFAFFVVMFATAQSDKSKAKDVSASVRDALEHGQVSAALSAALGRGKPSAADALRKPPQTAAEEKSPPPPGGPAQPADLKASMATLQKGLEAELKAGKVVLRLDARGLVISLREAAFFGSGDDRLVPNSYVTLEKIAEVVRGLPNPVRLEGHTDSVPIHNSRFSSNWELSSARSIAMLELLRERYRIPTERMAVAGYAENAPADTNSTEEGRAHNRRVDVVILSAEGLKREPPAPAAPAQKELVAAPTGNKPQG